MSTWTSCKDAAQTIAEELERKLPFHRRIALKFHLLICNACRRYRRQVIGINLLVRRYVRESSQPIVELDPATRQRFVESLREAAVKNIITTPAHGTPTAPCKGGPSETPPRD